MTSMSMAEWQSVIQQKQADFALNNKYKVIGKLDIVFENVSIGIQNDAGFDSLKQARTNEAVNIRRINQSSADADTKLKQTAQARMSFLQQALRGLQAAAQTSDPQNIVRAVNEMVTELSNAVSSYTTGMGTVQNSAQDASFLASAQRLAGGFKGLLATEKPRLAQANIFYSANVVSTQKLLDSIHTMLTTPVPAPKPAETVIAAPANPDGVDVSV